jgi:hypothetical protein
MDILQEHFEQAVGKRYPQPGNNCVKDRKPQSKRMAVKTHIRQVFFKIERHQIFLAEEARQASIHPHPGSFPHEIHI